jgi:Domain of unknown function (DUF4412)
MKFATHCLAVLVPMLGLAVPALADDLTILTKMTRGDEPPTTATSYVTVDHVRVVQADGREFMADLKSGNITMMDGKKKQYSVLTRQDMELIKARIQQQANSPEMQKAQEQMKNLPPDIQKRMQAAMGGLVNALTVQKTGTTRKVAGYTCENFLVSFGQFSKTEQCMSTELPLPDQAWDSYRDFANSMMGMMGSMGPMSKGVSELREKMKDLKGFPMSVTTTTTLMGRELKSTSEVVEVRRGPVPAAAWQVPAGYTKVDSPLMKGVGSR